MFNTELWFVYVRSSNTRWSSLQRFLLSIEQSIKAIFLGNFSKCMLDLGENNAINSVHQYKRQFDPLTPACCIIFSK